MGYWSSILKLNLQSENKLQTITEGEIQCRIPRQLSTLQGIMLSEKGKVQKNVVILDQRDSMGVWCLFGMWKALILEMIL